MSNELLRYGILVCYTKYLIQQLHKQPSDPYAVKHINDIAVLHLPLVCPTYMLYNLVSRMLSDTYQMCEHIICLDDGPESVSDDTHKHSCISWWLCKSSIS